VSAPNPAEYLVYLADRIEEQEAILVKVMDAVNNLDVRLMMAERAITKINRRLDGTEYDETKSKWWN
jgi:hypothetical protein